MKLWARSLIGLAGSLVAALLVLTPVAQAAATPSTGSQPQTIGFLPMQDMTLGLYGYDDTSALAIASSSLPISFSAAGSCTAGASYVWTVFPNGSPIVGYSGDVAFAAPVHATGPGACSITASQAGDSTYAPAEDVTRSFTIFPGVTTPVVTITRAPGNRRVPQHPPRAGIHPWVIWFTVSDPNHVVGFACSLDGGRYFPCGSPFRHRSFSPGRHVFRVKSAGVKGEESAPAVARFRVGVKPG